MEHRMRGDQKVAVKSGKKKADRRYDSFGKKNEQWHAKIEKSVRQLDRAAKHAANGKRAAS